MDLSTGNMQNLLESLTWLKKIKMYYNINYRLAGITFSYISHMSVVIRDVFYILFSADGSIGTTCANLLDFLLHSDELTELADILR